MRTNKLVYTTASYRPVSPCQTYSGNVLGPSSLNYSVTGPPGYDRYGQHYSSFLYQQTGRDPFPHTVTSSSGSVYVASIPRHNSQGQARSRLSERDSRPPVTAKSANNNRVEPQPKNSKSNLPHSDSGHVCHNTHLPQFMSPIPEPRALAIHALSQDWQGRSMYMFPPLPLLNKSIQKIRSTQEGEVILIAPWWPSQWWFPQLDHPRTIPVAYFQNRDMSRMASRISPRMEALTQHYQEAGFSKEVSRLAAAPRRPLTNRMYNQRWPHFAHRATGQGIHPLGPTAAQIAAFLYYLFDTHGLSPQTIK